MSLREFTERSYIMQVLDFFWTKRSTKSFYKETPAKVFSCEFWKNVKNIYFVEELKTMLLGYFYFGVKYQAFSVLVILSTPKC